MRSAARVTIDGDHSTGQGGTPLDKPRCWGDSWQITAQAAAAGLILIRMFPFEAPEGYSSSGYKSQVFACMSMLGNARRVCDLPCR
eukprot:762919-Hanusia_phi.AAC.5